MCGCANVRMCPDSYRDADVPMPARIPRSGETGANAARPEGAGADVPMCECADVRICGCLQFGRKITHAHDYSLTSHVSRLPIHDSRLTSHVSRF
jgi:hypothetical protein